MREVTDDWWITSRKGQWCWNCFHAMTSYCAGKIHNTRKVTFVMYDDKYCVMIWQQNISSGLEYNACAFKMHNRSFTSCRMFYAFRILFREWFSRFPPCDLPLVYDITLDRILRSFIIGIHFVWANCHFGFRSSFLWHFYQNTNTRSSRCL